MIEGLETKMNIGQPTVHVVDFRGHTPEELAEFALARIISIGDQSPPFIRDQALAFKDRIRDVLIHYLRMAQQSQHGTIYGTLMKQGQEDTAKIIQQVKE